VHKNPKRVNSIFTLIKDGRSFGNLFLSDTNEWNVAGTSRVQLSGRSSILQGLGHGPSAVAVNGRKIRRKE
jgi:hypothetical protein